MMTTVIHGHVVRGRPRLAWVIAGALLGCGPAVELPDGSQEEATATDPGVQPEPGGMYAPCDAVAQCSPYEFCVFPQGEQGFCADACISPDDPEGCDPAPGQGAAVGCLDIGVPDGRWVCALDCNGATCPAGMTCEAVQTPQGPREICF